MGADGVMRSIKSIFFEENIHFSCVCHKFLLILQRHLWSITNLGAKGTRKTH